MMPIKILLADPFSDRLCTALSELPATQVVYQPTLTLPEFIHHLHSTQILIFNSRFRLTPETIDEAPHLKLVVRAGIGLDHIDTGYLSQKNIAFAYTAGANADAVGEHTLGVLLALRHHLYKAMREVKSFAWVREENRGQEIKGKTVGIVGYGNTGQALAKKLSGFGCRVLAYDKYKAGFSDEFAREATMQQLHAESDILSLHIPLTEETAQMVDGRYWRAFKKPLTFLNFSRGEIVILKDLLLALERGKVLAAGLDVLENEKLDTLTRSQRQTYERLFVLPNVLVTPHIGGWTVESKENIELDILHKVKAFMG